MTGLLVRSARPDDCAALSDLLAELGYEASSEDVAARLPLLENGPEAVLVAELDSALVGCLTTSAMQTIHRPAKVGRISMMVVSQPFRSKGVGRALVKAAEERLIREGCYIMEVTSRFELQDAHAFYEALGYTKTSIRLAREM